MLNKQVRLKRQYSVCLSVKTLAAFVFLVEYSPKSSLDANENGIAKVFTYVGDIGKNYSNPTFQQTPI